MFQTEMHGTVFVRCHMGTVDHVYMPCCTSALIYDYTVDCAKKKLMVKKVD
jgi:hypothetical protein